MDGLVSERIRFCGVSGVSDESSCACNEERLKNMNKVITAPLQILHRFLLKGQILHP